MKNIFRVMAVIVLFLGFLFTTHNSAEAATTYSPAGCTATTAYSPLTGQKCIGSVLGASSAIESGVDPVRLPPEAEDFCTYVKGPAIQVLSPNGGETYTAGQQITVKWKTCNIPSTEYIRLDLVVAPFPPTGTNGVSLANTLNDGEEVVTLPQSSIFNGNPMSFGKNFEVYAWPSTYSGITAPQDLSDDTFTINDVKDTTCGKLLSPITVLSPNGGETYTAGQQITVKWKTCDIPETNLVDIHIAHFSPTGGGLGGSNYLASLTIGGTINDGIETVTLPTQYSGRPFGKNFKILVVKHPYSISSSLYDFSDNLFTINDSTIGECNNGGYIQTMNTNPQLKNWGVINPNQTPSRIWIGDVTFKACENLSFNGSEITVQADSGVGAFSSFEAFDGVNMVGSGQVFQSPGQLSWVTITYNSAYPLVLNQSKTLKYWGYLNSSSNGRGSLSIIPKMTPPSSGTISPGDNPYTTADASFTLVSGLGGKINFSNSSSKTLKIGSRGDAVKALQELLNVKADGIYGKGTANKVKAWQLSNALKPDGVFGPASWAKINSSN